MKKIGYITDSQIRESGKIQVNNTNLTQANELFFVQLDDLHAVDYTGAIFQILDKNDAAVISCITDCLQYEGDSGIIYNYAGDLPEFELDSESFCIYANCVEEAANNTF